MGKFIVSRGKNNQFYWSLKSTNGKIIAQSEGYKSRRGAFHGIAAVIKAVEKNCKVEEKE